MNITFVLILCWIVGVLVYPFLFNRTEHYSIHEYFRLMQHITCHFAKKNHDLYGLLWLDHEKVGVLVQDRATITIAAYDVSYDPSTMKVTAVEPAVLSPPVESTMHSLIKKSSIFK